MTTRSLLRATRLRWLHPLVRYGASVARQGVRSGSTTTTWTGVAYVVVGLVLSRRTFKRLRRRPLYRTELGPEESVRIKVVQDDADVSDVSGD